MPLFSWSQTSSSNASADATINWREGQAPSTINDSARAMMSATAKYRDDIAGAIVTAGVSTAYTVTSYSGFDTLAHLAGQVIAFTPHTTNGATVTLNVDGLGAKPLRSAPNTELLAGVLIQGTPYLAVYNSTDGAFYLQSFFGNPYNVPLGSSLEFWGSTAPNSSFAFMYGQAISRTTYSALFSLVGTTYGTGDGLTTFNIPDLRGRVVAGVDNMGGTAANRLTSGGSGINGAALGASGGGETNTLQRSDLPNDNVSVTIVDPGHTHSHNANSENANDTTGGGSFSLPSEAPATISIAYTGISASFHLNGNVTQTAMNNMPPAITANKILRII